MVKSFGSDDLNERRTSSNDDVPIADASRTASELENDNINEDLITGDEDGNNNDNNDANKDPINNNDKESTEDNSGSKDGTASSAITPKDSDAPWVAMFAIANKNGEWYQF